MMRIVLLLLTIALMAAPRALAASPEGEPLLKQGSSGSRVQQLQERLIELGLLRGKADALYGKRTTAAVRQAQERLRAQGHSLSVDGIAGPQTLQLLYDDAAVAFLLDMKEGDKGERVSDLQAQLYDIRMLETPPDGAFGSLTRQAVLRFQQMLVDNGVPGAALTGVADKVTRTALSGDLKPLGLRLPQTFDDTRPDTLGPDDLYARAALVLDTATGQEYLDKRAGQRLYPASTTKIMTLLLAVQQLDPDQLVTIPQEAADVPEDSSVTPVTPGEQMTSRDLMYGLMLPSGNDAGNALAVIIDGSVDAFVARMNRKAQELGLSNTHFVNPHGYHHPDHYTTARDLARLTAHALKYPVFLEVVSHTQWTMQPTALRQALPLKVSAELLDPQSPYYYEGAFGVKSGFTRASGYCYVGCAQRNGRTLLAVVLNDRIRSQAWTDLARLFNLGFAAI